MVHTLGDATQQGELDSKGLWAEPRSGVTAAHVRICLALLPSGPDAVRRLTLHRFRTAVQPASNRVYYTATRVASSRYFASTSPTMTAKKST